MFRPFLTAGIGAAWNDMEGWTRIEPGAPQPVRNFSGNTETNFAWAVGGGMSVDLGHMFIAVQCSMSPIATSTPVKPAAASCRTLEPAFRRKP